MYTGSSALNYEGRKQINSPKLRVTLQEGLNYRESGASFFTDSNNKLKEVFLFNNHIITSKQYYFTDVPYYYYPVTDTGDALMDVVVTGQPFPVCPARLREIPLLNIIIHLIRI